ncbi:tail fiber protein [Ancylomarina sp. YFZ004]
MTRKIHLIISFIMLLTFTAQAQNDKELLKSHFRSGNAPGQSEFHDLINFCYNYSVGKGLKCESGTLNAEVTLDLLNQILADSAQKNQFRLDSRFQTLEQKLNADKIDVNNKLSLLEIALQDTDGALRQSLRVIEESISSKHETDKIKLVSLISDLEKKVITKIDSLANAQNADKLYQDIRMTTIEENHNVLNDTVVKMKIKLDTLNYTEHDFTQTLKLKLNNIEEGATRSDNNFADSLVTKLLAIEKNANNYQLPMSSHAKLGGIKLSGDFVLYDGKVYSALDPEKVDRWYATDTILNDWSNVMLVDQKWTKVRMKIPTGDADADGKKLYDYGEFNPPYKFIYDDLETSYYEYNGTDESNVILGEHEKQKKILGTKNTLIGHKAGYNLFEGGDENVIIGFQAGQSSANVSHNVFVGSRAGQNIQGGSDNVGQMNVAIGSRSMSGRNNNKESLALGFASMELGEQQSSVAIGIKAMGKNSGDNNIAIGYEAALSAEGSNNKQNINLGYRAAYASMTAHRNIGIGDSTAFSNISGKGNLFIGHGSGKTNTLSGNLFIGHAIDEGGSDKMLIGNNGKVLISGDFNKGTVSIDKFSSNQIKIGEDKEVINASAQFVGEGGVNTSTVIASKSLSAAGVEIIKKDGAVLTERYAQKAHSHSNSDFVTDAAHRFVSDTEKGSWNNKVDKIAGKSLSSQDFTLSLKTKLAGIEAGSNKYAHPNTHAATMISTDTDHQFVSETEKSEWSAGEIPLGGIIMWSGATIPDGWELCDGGIYNGNETPDLRDRFVVGSGNAYTVNDIGGEDTVKLKEEEMPAHNHALSSEGKHSHKGSAKYGGSHNHKLKKTISEHHRSFAGRSGSDHPLKNKGNFYMNSTESAGSHSHTLDISENEEHVHKVGNTGGGLAHENRPPYYALAFIMRVK